MTITIRDIQRRVCDEWALPPAAMKTAARTRQIARPRQIAMYLARKLTKHSLPVIGRHFGGRDHTTVLHAERTVADLLARSEIIARTVANIEADLVHASALYAAQRQSYEAGVM